jgi:ribonuclease R
LAKDQKQPRVTPFPSKEDILKFIETSPETVSKREIARAFHIRGDARRQLKDVLRELREEGLLKRGDRKRLTKKGMLPNVGVIEVTGTDIDGELVAKPTSWDEDSPPPIIYVLPGKKPGTSMGRGDRALARLTKMDEGHYEAAIMRRLERATAEVLGVFRRDGVNGRILPTDKKNRHELIVEAGDEGDASHGDLVLAKLKPGRPRAGLKRAQITQSLGHVDSSKSTSLIAIHAHGIPNEFSPATLEEANKAKAPTLGRREDLRDIPLVTIDPADARDHDDALWAEPDPDENNKGGWHVIVAIADVANYVQPGTSLDIEAYERGNSAYFPDRVVPMLPTALSNDLCSLVEDKDRACMAAHLWFDAEGRMKRHKFTRALMRCVGNITYQQTQAAIDGNTEAVGDDVLDGVLRPLYGAYASRLIERAKRQPLNLDLPERKIELDEDGNVARIAERQRLDAHKLVEEFMIAANVAAAETLEKKKVGTVYRVHEAPGAEKMSALREFLQTLDIAIPKAQRLQPGQFNKVLDQVQDTAHAAVVNTIVLRSQSQACYAPDNLGHFGLALERYAHFTSPIRRYADLIVHRALIRALGLGDDGLSPDTEGRLTEIGEHISKTERRAMAAERDSVDRYMASYMKERIGAQFEGRISGVSRFGLFIALAETGADGLVPISTLGQEFFHHDESKHALIGERTGVTLILGDMVTVRLAEAVPLTGGLRFELIHDGLTASTKRPQRKGKKHKGKQGRGRRR